MGRSRDANDAVALAQDFRDGGGDGHQMMGGNALRHGGDRTGAAEAAAEGDEASDQGGQPPQQGQRAQDDGTAGGDDLEILKDAHSGMFPCFLGGRVSRFDSSTRSPSATRSRVWDGSMTSVTKPLAAE